MKRPLALLVFYLALVGETPPSGLWAAEDRTIFNEEIKPVSFETLAYPLVARLKRVQGVVVVRVTLDQDGRVRDSAAISGPESLIADCIENSKKWRFQPGSGKTAVILYQFKFEGLCFSPCPSHATFWPPNLMTVATGDPIAQQ
jgi:TonB family protein